MKVCLYPDWLISKSDGDRHYITADQLKHLYGVRNDDEVVVVDINRKETFLCRDLGEFIHLHPLSDGKYYDIHNEVTP